MPDPHDLKTDRRGFIKEAALALLTVQILPANARAAESASGAPTAPAGTLVVHSGPGFVPHTHDLWIPYAILRAPPAGGVKLTSTVSRGHTHEVALSLEDLTSVNRGGTVSVKGGSHTFVIAMTPA